MTERLECDLLILGAGLAGLSAGAKAAEQGARVIVVEKQDRPGGSSALSGGVMWTIQSPRKMTYHVEGRSDLAEVVVGRYRKGVAWLRARDVSMSPAMPVLHGQGYQIDILGHLRDCVLSIEQAGGHLVLGSTARELTTDAAGRVTGAVISHPDGEVAVSSPWTLLATGGYQGDAELRARHIHTNARDMRLRSNPASRGDGLRLGQSVGGAFHGGNPGFYGHLVTASPDWGDPALYTTLSQYHSDHGLLLNERGERFCDESAGDHVNTQCVLAQPGARALLVWDERVQRDHVLQPFIKVATPLDRMAVALQRGGEGGVMGSLEDIGRFAAAHGFDGARAVRTLEDYNRDSHGAWERIEPLRIQNFETVESPPYYVLIVYPAITFTYGGLKIDAQARVLGEDDAPVGGLLAAGADAGDAYWTGYGGGLALALSLGLRAAETAGYA